jgi:hypothetical protein
LSHAATAGNFPSVDKSSWFGSTSLLYIRFILARAANANVAITLETDGAAGEAQVMIIRNAQTKLVATLLNRARPNFIGKGNSKSLSKGALTIYRPLTQTHEEYSSLRLQ